MSWVGSKARNAEFILAILNDSQYDGMPYLEPFVGMGHVLSRVQRKQSYRASDNCQLLMILLGAVQRGEPLPTITKDEYYALKSRPDSLKKATAAITYSFNGKLFGGFTEFYHRKTGWPTSGILVAVALVPARTGVSNLGSCGACGEGGAVCTCG